MNVDREHRSWVSSALWLDRNGVYDRSGELVSPAWTQESVIRAMRSWEHDHKRRPTSRDLARSEGWPMAVVAPRRRLPPVRVVIRLFGRLTAAFEAAGYESRPGIRVRYYTRRCQWCKATFRTPAKDARGCSKRCRERLREQPRREADRAAKSCDHCGATPLPPDKARFCSDRCGGAHRSREYRRRAATGRGSTADQQGPRPQA